MVLDVVPHGFSGVANQVICVLESTQCQEVCIYVILYDVSDNSLAIVSTFQTREEVGCLQESERSVMMAVVAAEPVCYRCLWRNGLQCRVVTGCTHGSIESVIADSPSSYIAIVMGVLEQPFDGIISIGCLVNVLLVLLSLFILIQGTYLYKFAFAFIASTYILINDDVILLYINT